MSDEEHQNHLETIEECVAARCTRLSSPRPTSRVSSAAQSNAPSPGSALEDDDSDEEFVYPGVSGTAARDPLTDLVSNQRSASVSPARATPSPDVSVSQEPPQAVPPPVEAKPAKAHPSPAQLESLQAAASTGDLNLLQRLFRTALRTGEVEPFALANDASPRTGLTALHAASSRGYLNIVKWRACHFSSP